MGGGDANMGERWYNIENSATKHQTLSRLECELGAAFQFKHGGGKSTILVWVMQILLGYLLREMMVLGQAIKQFSKF